MKKILTVIALMPFGYFAQSESTFLELDSTSVTSNILNVERSFTHFKGYESNSISQYQTPSSISFEVIDSTGSGLIEITTNMISFELEEMKMYFHKNGDVFINGIKTVSNSEIFFQMEMYFRKFKELNDIRIYR